MINNKFKQKKKEQRVKRVNIKGIKWMPRYLMWDVIEQKSRTTSRRKSTESQQKNPKGKETK